MPTTINWKPLPRKPTAAQSSRKIAAVARSREAKHIITLLPPPPRRRRRPSGARRKATTRHRRSATEIVFRVATRTIAAAAAAAAAVVVVEVMTVRVTSAVVARLAVARVAQRAVTPRRSSSSKLKLQKSQAKRRNRTYLPRRPSATKSGAIRRCMSENKLVGLTFILVWSTRATMEIERKVF